MNVANCLDITEYVDNLLGVRVLGDYPNAVNGLQLENSGAVMKIASAVDASEWTLRAAAAAGVQLLIVHHGLFWSGLQPICGSFYRKIKLAMEADIAVYSVHLPLDSNAQLGNNVLLAKALDIGLGEPAFHEKGYAIGRLIYNSIGLQELTGRLEKAVGGAVKVIAGGPPVCRRIGIVSGGAGTRILEAAKEEKVDTFITGEGAHWTFSAAEEAGVNLIYAGHYATETFGVKALAEELALKFGLPWEFINHPSGL